MAALLLTVIYIAFIGLGIPDSLFGTAWPVISGEFGRPIGDANLVSVMISGGTILASLCAVRVIKRIGTAKTAALSTGVTAAALLGFSLSGEFWVLCLLALPLGIGAGAIDTALNNYVAIHYKASHMNFLHCFYGVGVSLSPYLMSLVLGEGDWRRGYGMAFGLQTAITLITVLSLPLWKKVHGVERGAGEEQIRELSVKELAGLPGIGWVWLIFLTSCGLEYTCGNWGSSYLVGARGMGAHRAAEAVMFYYVGMATGRFLSGVLSGKLSSWQLIRTGQTAVLAALAVLLLPLPGWTAALGLFMIGLGNGPLFPNLIHLIPSLFGQKDSTAVMGSQMAASYIGILLIPTAFGFLAQQAGVQCYPVYLAILFGVMAVATLAVSGKRK